MTRHGRTARTSTSAGEPALLGELPVPSSSIAVAERADAPPLPARAGASRAELVGLAGGLRSASATTQRNPAHAATGLVLDWLETFPGSDWQDRWILSGSDEQGSGWGPSGVSPGRRARFTAGLGALLALRAIRPSYRWLFASRMLGAYDLYRRHNQTATFGRLHRQLTEHGGCDEYTRDALNLVTRMVIVTGKDVLDIDLADVTAYAQARLASGRPVAALPLAYQALHAMGGLTGAPATLAQSRTPGRLTAAQLVDRYHVADRDVRDVLVHYLAERAAVLDYASVVNQSQMLVALFWTDLERHHPGICSLSLPDDVAQGWKQRIRVLPDGRPRLNCHAVLLAVRSFYLDLRQWSLEDPARWAPWAAPCPIREADVRSYVRSPGCARLGCSSAPAPWPRCFPDSSPPRSAPGCPDSSSRPPGTPRPASSSPWSRPGIDAPAGTTATGGPPRCSSPPSATTAIRGPVSTPNVRRTTPSGAPR